jgi:hypothetical protein
VRILSASLNGNSIRIRAVGVVDSRYSDQTLTVEQFRDLVSEVRGGTYRFDAERASSVSRRKPYGRI